MFLVPRVFYEDCTNNSLIRKSNVLNGSFLNNSNVQSMTYWKMQCTCDVILYDNRHLMVSLHMCNYFEYGCVKYLVVDYIYIYVYYFIIIIMLKLGKLWIITIYLKKVELFSNFSWSRNCPDYVKGLNKVDQMLLSIKILKSGLLLVFIGKKDFSTETAWCLPYYICETSVYLFVMLVSWYHIS